MSITGERVASQRPADRLGIVPQRLRPPRVRSDHLVRDELIGRLRKADVPVVAVRGGAGFGKSTVLSQLVAAESGGVGLSGGVGWPGGVGWLSVERSDSDPVVFARHLVSGLADAGTDVSRVAEVLSGPEPQMLRDVVPALAEALDATASAFLFVLDDVHLLQGEDSTSLLDTLLDLVPDGSCVVVSGRHVSGLGLARRELDGELVSFDERDLAYSDDEGVALIRRELPNLTDRYVSELLRVTGRWPAGVHLGILALRDHPDPPVVMEGLLASDRRVVAYLREEVLARLDAGTRTFLTEISVLDRISAPLCDAVTGRDDSSERLDRLAASGNLFISPVDSPDDGLHIHQLFADMLLMELRSDDPAREAVLRSAAARWLDQHGDADAAVRQALLAGEPDLAARIVYRNHSRLLIEGRSQTLHRWIRSFPGDVTASNGLLAIAAGWASIFEGDGPAVAHRLESARRLHVDGVLPDGTTSYAVAVAALETMSADGGVIGTISTAERVLAAGPGASPWWRLARHQWAVSTVLAGRGDPLEVFNAAELDTRGEPSVHAVTLAHLALAHVRVGDRDRAEDLVAGAMRELEDHDLFRYPVVGMVHCVTSLVAALRGDHKASRRAAGEAGSLLGLTERFTPRAGAQARQLLAEAALIRHETDVASDLLRSSAPMTRSEPDAAVLHRRQEELEVRLDQMRRNPDVASLTAAEIRVLEQLRSHRSLEEIGDLLFVSRNTVKTHTMSIYRKLGVSSRSEAVERAWEIGIS